MTGLDSFSIRPSGRRKLITSIQFVMHSDALFPMALLPVLSDIRLIEAVIDRILCRKIGNVDSTSIDHHLVYSSRILPPRLFSQLQMLADSGQRIGSSQRHGKPCRQVILDHAEPLQS